MFRSKMIAHMIDWPLKLIRMYIQCPFQIYEIVPKSKSSIITERFGKCKNIVITFASIDP